MEKEKQLTDNLLPKEPKLANLRASVAATTTPKKGAKPALKKETETKTTPKPRPLSGQQVRYAMENLPNANNLSKNDNGRLKTAWRRVRGYKRHFGHLDFSDMPGNDAPPAVVEAFVDDLGGQLGEEKGVETLKHIYLTILDIAVSANNSVGDPWQLCISELPKIARKEFEEKSFLDNEMKELAILHPELCRPNVYLRTFYQTYNLVKEVSDRAKGRVTKLADQPIPTDLRSKYADL